MRRATKPKVPACSSCRKLKVRCEILDDLTQESLQNVRCHRCKTLKIQCSYESMDKSIFRTGPEKMTTSLIPTVSIPKIPAPNPAPLIRGLSTVVARSSTGQTVVDMDSLPTHIWQFYRGSTGDWHYGGIFHYEDSLDWAHPLDAIQQLSDRYNASVASVVTRPRILAAATSRSASGIDRLDEILSPEQIKHLLEIFEEKYVPWLNFSLIRNETNPSNSPEPSSSSSNITFTLDLICCTIASRHLRPSVRSVVAPKLEAAAEDAVSEILFHPVLSESIESIQSLLILALWAPICGGSGSNRRDGHLLLVSAISMAKNIRLDEAPERLSALEYLRSLGHTFDEVQMADTANKARLWLSLTNADSLLCVGHGRNTYASRFRSSTSTSLFPMPTPSSPTLPTGLSEARDTRLDLFGQILDATEAGLKVPLNSLDDVPKWYNDIHEALQRLGHLERLITPLPVVSDHDTFYFRMLVILYRACRLLVLYHATFSARMLFMYAGRTLNLSIFEGIIPHNLDILMIWSKDAFHTTEANLISLLEVDVSLLGTSPDITFHIISLIVTYLVSYKFYVFNLRYKASPFTHDSVNAKCIARCIGVLNTAAYSEDHPAVRCARLIEGVQALWENREEMFKLGDAPVLRPEDRFRVTSKKPGYYKDQSTMQEAFYETVEKNLEMLYKPAGPS
ncbi:hypothetical protein K435DRAFT_839495 [Dendrothele bispora CBS 962.96]|uniref:Zn(2)-C6 fungal-type domain-containing protein n=1 Tax=Dendrothele bispora (strain CBS 962.96) TaxID=1314807 RepID=A0A4S8M1H3_DENBC|nr:hypothetical protein K435DRAFT_839495 [Dendrothele bispora CBS 962.96]